MTDKLNSALELASSGLYIFPLRDFDATDINPKTGLAEFAGKKPRLNDWEGEATLAPARIREWWGRWPQANIGIAAGKSGLLVIDIDPDKGGNIELLPLSVQDRHTVTSDTGGKGDGFHKLYRQPLGVKFGNSNTMPKGCDSRGHGGYIVGPGSVHPETGTVYAWQPGAGPGERKFLPLPFALGQLLKEKGEPPAEPPPTVILPKSNGNSAYAQAALTSELSTLAAATEGDRNDFLNKAAFSLGQFVAAGELAQSEVETALTDIALSIGLSEAETPKTITSGISKGMKQPRQIPPADYPDRAPDAGQTVSENGKEPEDAGTFLTSEGTSDDGNAQCILKLFPDTFLYCPAFGSSGWLYFNGKFWQSEHAEGRLDRHIVEMLAERAKAGLDAGADENGKWKRLDLIRFCTPSKFRLTGCKALLKSLIEVSISEFDADKDLLNCANGVVDLRTGELQKHRAGQNFTYCLSTKYTPDADVGDWITWLRETVNGDFETVQYLQQAVGYSLTGRTDEECFFYIFGDPRSGKGTFTETLLKLLSRPLSEGVDFATFTEKRDHDSQNFDLAGLKATRFIVASESNKYQVLNPRRIKSITGGDAVRCAHKHGAFFSYFPQFKIWLASNHPVKADAEDPALWARVNVINFPISHLGKEDKSLKRKMLSETNLEGVLSWAVKGAIAWYQSLPDGLKPPSNVANATEVHRSDNDFSGRFIDDCIEAADGEFLPHAVWKAVYKEWCSEQSLKPKERKVNDKLKEIYFRDRAVLSSDDIEKAGYDGIVKPHVQERGYFGAKIAIGLLNEYLQRQ